MTRVAAVGVLTGWGDGVAALPADAMEAAAGRDIIPLTTARPSGERFRRATRECILGVAAVEAMLADAGLDRAAIRGSGTALVYVTAAAYGASNRAFIDAAVTGSALHFPYTAPSAVPAEVTIEFGLTGPYVILIGGAATTIDALWHASTLVARGAAERALVLAVETFTECSDLWSRARRITARPLVEAAACALVVPGDHEPQYAPTTDGEPRPAEQDRGARRLEGHARTRAGQVRAHESDVRFRVGETLACGPLIDFALARAGRGSDAASQPDGRSMPGPQQCAADFGEPSAPSPAVQETAIRGDWRGRRASLAWYGE